MIVCVVYLKNLKLFSKFSSVFQYTTNGIAIIILIFNQLSFFSFLSNSKATLVDILLY